MRVLLFAGLAEALGRRELELSPDETPSTVGELEHVLRERWPALASMPFRIAVNQRYVNADDSVDVADEIALIPPVSGG